MSHKRENGDVQGRIHLSTDRLALHLVLLQESAEEAYLLAGFHLILAVAGIVEGKEVLAVSALVGWLPNLPDMSHALALLPSFTSTRWIYIHHAKDILVLNISVVDSTRTDDDLRFFPILFHC